MQTFYLAIGMIAFAIGIFIFYKARLTLGYKHLKYRFQRRDYADVAILLEGGGYVLDALPLTSQGTKMFLQDKNEKYGYSPIANGFGVVEENNALPIVRGGWMEIEDEKEARKATGVNIEEGKPLTEEQTGKLFRWVINKGKLKTTLIRPLTRWSSKELNDAIKSKVIEELLDIPLKMIDIAILCATFAVLALTVYYGYQNNNVLQQILVELTESPYVPIPP